MDGFIRSIRDRSAAEVYIRQSAAQPYTHKKMIGHIANQQLFIAEFQPMHNAGGTPEIYNRNGVKFPLACKRL